MSTTEPCMPLIALPSQHRTLRIGLLLVLGSCHAALAASIPELAHFHRSPPPNHSSEPDQSSGWYFLGAATGLVLLGGLFAGLTIALMSQDETHLKVVASSGESSKRRNAARVLWLLGKGKHWVLVTLLLCNVITNETLPIVLHKSLGGGGWVAVVSSTFMIGRLMIKHAQRTG